MAIRNARLHHGVESERSRMDAILANSPDGTLFMDVATGRSSRIPGPWRCWATRSIPPRESRVSQVGYPPPPDYPFPQTSSP